MRVGVDSDFFFFSKWKKLLYQKLDDRDLQKTEVHI